jgi:hypothetical protein
MINVMVLQNHMDLLRCELHSCSETCVTSTQVERVSDVTEEDEQEAATIPVIKTEPMVSCVCGECRHISYGLYPELPAPLSVCTGGGIDCTEWILSTF